MKKLLLVLTLVLCIAAQMILPAGAAIAGSFGSDIILPPDEFGDDPLNQFNDLKAGAWYTDAVKFVVEKGYMSGTSGSTFAPNKELTRAEFVQVLYKIMGSKVSAANPFTDVVSGRWYYDAVLWAYKNKITSGTTAATFEPDTKVTREQVAQFMYNAYGASTTAADRLSGFSDGSTVSKWAKNAMSWAIQKGIVSGVKHSDGSVTLSPKQTATRAELASIIYRMKK